MWCFKLVSVPATMTAKSIHDVVCLVNTWHGLRLNLQNPSCGGHGSLCRCRRESNCQILKVGYIFCRPIFNSHTIRYHLLLSQLLANGETIAAGSRRWLKFVSGL